MDKLQEYAEAKRSGAYKGALEGSPIGDSAMAAANQARRAAEADLQRFSTEPVFTYQQPVTKSYPWLWTAINVLISLVLIGIIIYMVKFMDHEDVAHSKNVIQNVIQKMPTSVADFKAAFLDWAYTDGNILKIDCETRDKFGKSSEILTGCRFSFMETVDAAPSKQNIKPL